jgi:hypothetical protein
MRPCTRWIPRLNVVRDKVPFIDLDQRSEADVR